MGALGGTLSKLAAVMQCNHGVDLRTGVTVTALYGNGSFTGAELSRGEVTHKPPFLRLDDPEHHRLRTLAMRPFGPLYSPGRVDALRGEIDEITKELMKSFEAGRHIDVVDDFAYPLPATVICRLLGVPPEDEPLFRAWSDALVAAADVRPGEDSTETDQAGDQARIEMGVPGEPRRAAPRPAGRRHALRLRQRAGSDPAAQPGRTRGNRRATAHRRT
ncbi:hypothetical protein ACGF3K_35095 [Streptomyces sp. NPDC047980]|uniref:hypothetical protein n=1 Tax=Streptomyces sp. NPDC047980 TaxID=3365494 RepID=UPI0037115A75